METEDRGSDEAPWSPPMVVVGRKGNSYQLRWGGSGMLLERLVPGYKVKRAPRGTKLDGVYDVGYILDHRPADSGVQNKDVEYLVKWVGFDIIDATWEPAEHMLVGAQDAISDYWAARVPRVQQPLATISGRQRARNTRVANLASKIVPH